MPSIRINNIDVYYERHGKGSPVVLVAGFSVDHRVWLNMISVFAAHHEVIVFDNRGVGGSSCPDVPYTAEMMADDTVGLVRALGLSRAHFIGSSFGGCVVQMVAKRHPEVVQSAVLVCSFVKADMRLVQYGRLRLEMREVEVPDALVGRFLALVGFSNAFMRLPGTVEQMIAAGPHAITPAGLKHQLDAMLAFDSRGWIGELACPTLVVGAEEDILAEVADSHFMAARIRNSELHCFEGVGHVPMLERAEDFSRLTLDFLRRQDGG